MSKNEKVTEEKEKVMTKYDLKMQRRKEEKEREKKERTLTNVVSVLILIGFIALAASFPIRSYLAVNGMFIQVGDDKLSKIEFDYNYNVVKDNYIDAYGPYLAYFGLDVSGDLSQQSYDGDLTWEDYFQEMAVDNLKRTKALKADAIANGFQYDTTEEYNRYVENLKEAASNAGVSVDKYVNSQYGELANLKRIEPIIKETMMVTAYHEKITKDKLPTDEEIVAYYEDDKDCFDSVDYRIEEIYAELPTEPTALADPGYEASEDEIYEPSEAEIAKAMREAKAKADESYKTIATAGELKEGERRDSIMDPAQTWLFDSARKAGDKAVLEDEDSHSYVVVSLVKRYRDETATINVRAIMTSEDGDAILEEWKNGEATENSFAALADKYTMDTSAKGGLYEKLTKNSFTETVDAWLFDSARKSGDVANLKLSDEYCYVVYYIGEDIPQWKADVQKEISETTMTEYVDALIEKCEVKDPKNNLKYIKIRESQEAAEALEDDDAEIDLSDLDIETDDGMEVSVEEVEE